MCKNQVTIRLSKYKLPNFGEGPAVIWSHVYWCPLVKQTTLCCQFCWNQTSAVMESGISRGSRDKVGECTVFSPRKGKKREEEICPIRKENPELGARGNVFCIILLGLRNR